jgi:Kef-type K+ transport system membrane component KefB
MGATAFVAFMFLVARPLVKRFVARFDDARRREIGNRPALLGMVLAALVTEAAGIHAFFGAFLAGALVPHRQPSCPTTQRHEGRRGGVAAALVLCAGGSSHRDSSGFRME